jgi:hypothetical protein
MRPFEALVAMALVTPLPALAAEPSPEGSGRRAFFGDLHLHTSYSMDAVILGGTLTTLDDAYRFAQGEAVDHRGQTLQLDRPLDFLGITDHAEQMGVGRDLYDETTPVGKSDLGRRFRERLGATTDELRALFQSRQPIPGVDTGPTVREAWQREMEAAKSHYRPGSFATFLGFEWSATPGQQNLHRNVIFRGDEAPLPFSSADSERPEDLWAWLDLHRARGIEALAIPHNANVSNGLMFDWNDSDGRPIDAAYATQRARNEPLVEISQTKGQSETHPELSPEDEFAAFELFETLFSGQRGKISGSYAREVWGRGLVLARRSGVDPFAFGVVGASDVHNGWSDPREETHRGPDGAGELPREEVLELLGISKDEPAVISMLATGSGNLTGIWADENTRESLYDALRRKETFATSGTRIVLRLFGGWSYEAGLLERRDWVAAATAGGVAMGSDLAARPPEAAAPRFAAWALMDPMGAKLERLQVVKVWLEGDAQAEKVFDVRVAGAGGAAELAALWRDPGFDAAQLALYYLRVLEVPTPRWSTLLATQKGLPVPESVPATIRERAWSSPIWYRPGG